MESLSSVTRQPQQTEVEENAAGCFQAADSARCAQDLGSRSGAAGKVRERLPKAAQSGSRRMHHFG